MAIVAPSRRINPTIRRRSDIGRKGVYAGLFLTSMVDMFAILVIFLLQSFSAEGELIVLPAGLQLPKAENVGTLEKALSLVIARDMITLEGEKVVSTNAVAAQSEWANPQLQEALKKFREKLRQEAQKSGEPLEKSLTKKLNISADRRLEFQVIKKVIYNAGFAGFPDFRFSVIASSSPK